MKNKEDILLPDEHKRFRVKPVLVSDDLLEIHFEDDVEFESMSDYDLLSHELSKRGVEIIAYSTKFNEDE